MSLSGNDDVLAKRWSVNVNSYLRENHVLYSPNSVRVVQTPDHLRNATKVETFAGWTMGDGNVLTTMAQWTASNDQFIMSKDESGLIDASSGMVARALCRNLPEQAYIAYKEVNGDASGVWDWLKMPAQEMYDFLTNKTYPPSWTPGATMQESTLSYQEYMCYMEKKIRGY